MRKHRYGTRNKRGERLLEFAVENDLFICNTRFQQNACRKWAWALHKDVHKNMIDLVIMQKKMENVDP